MQSMKVPSTRSSSNLSTTAIPTRFILDVEDLCQELLDWSQKLSSILNSNLETEDIKLKNCDLMLSGYDDVGVLLTDKTKDEVLRKFEEYRECDFLKLGQTPMEPLVFEKDDDLPLPPGSETSQKKDVYLCPRAIMLLECLHWKS
ncbi:uncharacterized protein LOC113353100 [Papaver somniferum]|uniref:uncharacterized protein LOC113353100 n=1 Tax=Papaver somniferum TaxID=3469 RepID=UPI000E70324C|nr:uncharacterized protein LOC113353100 [Papaver somniferum]